MSTATPRRLEPRHLGRLDLSLVDPRIVWASAASASSAWSDSYAARAACGPPSIFPEHGDRAGSWLAASEDRRPWIVLELPELPGAVALLVCETCGAGAIETITDVDRDVVLFEEKKRPPSRKSAQLLVVPLVEAPRRVRLKLRPAGDDYQQIDAVGLSSVPIEALIADPPTLGPRRHVRLAPSEVRIHALKTDWRIGWASRAEASSQYSSSYAPRAACGPPNVFPKGGDHDETWLAETGDHDAWIELSGFPEMDTCHGFLVAETCGAGAVVRATDGDRLLWQAPVEKIPHRQARLLHVPFEPGPPPSRLRLHLSSAVEDYREIDAVALLAAPLDALERPPPPPPPPPVPGAPRGGFTELSGTLVSVSAERPLLWATIRHAEGAMAVNVGDEATLRQGDGREVRLILERTVLLGRTLPRRTGRLAELCDVLPWLREAVNGRITEHVDVAVTTRAFTGEQPVHVAGIPVGRADAAGFRDAVSAPSALRVAVISERPLAQTDFVERGTALFDGEAQPLEKRRRWPHPLARTRAISAAVAGVGLPAAVAIVGLAPWEDAWPGIATAVTGIALTSLVLALEMIGRMATSCIDDRRAQGTNGRVRYLYPTWTVAGTATLVGLPVMFWALFVGTSDVPRATALGGLALLAGVHALVRVILWQRTAWPSLAAAIRILTAGASRTTSCLLAAPAQTRERFTEHSEHLGTEQRVGSDGRVETYDRHRFWTVRKITTVGTPEVEGLDGRSVRLAKVRAVLDVAMRPEKANGIHYAQFSSAHELGDEVTIIGSPEVSETSLKIEQATVVLGPLATARRHGVTHLIALAALLAIVALGGAALVLAQP